LSVESTIKY